MDSFISWVGGKKLLRKVICDQFPENEFSRYVEVFGGAGWVLFHKDKHAKMEVYNDINSELVNLFKCVKYHPKAIQEELDHLLYSREIFNYYKSLYKNPALTDIQRATMYYYMIKVSYGSKVTSFGAKNRDIAETTHLTRFRERLKRVVIENKDYETLIKQYDRPDTLFYCDPPYYGTEEHYDTGGVVFNSDWHIKLRDILMNINGMCVISYNNDEFIKELYKDFKIRDVERHSNLTGRYISKPYRELIITNY